MPALPLQIHLALETDTAALAQRIAPILIAGDVLLLSGPIGAGKSAFARALIRARLGQQTEVPSPTFTIVQTYRDELADIWHCDLYRLTHPDEAYELGLDDVFETAICLIEWPDRLGNSVPKNAIDFQFAALADGHAVTITLTDAWRDRLAFLND